MIRALSSVLLLGMFPHGGEPSAFTVPAGIENIRIAAPAREAEEALRDVQLSASGVLLLDAQSGQKLFGKNETEPRPMASLTKLMTALILIEDHEPDELVRIPKIASEQSGSAIGVTAGQTFSLEDLLYGLLLPSANDVAYALAVHHSGTVNAFVDEMNERARMLGLRSTHFANPAGFDDPLQYSSPEDIAWLTMAALRKPLLKEIVSTRHARIFSRDSVRFDLTNTNELLHSQENVFGMKTGTTGAARECLTTLFSEGETSYLLVLLGSEARYGDTLKVMRALGHPETEPLPQVSTSGAVATCDDCIASEALSLTTKESPTTEEEGKKEALRFLATLLGRTTP